MCHEICHLFCLSHCVYFSCAMNGSNHLEESNRRPMFLCPVCLVKLKSTKLNFDIKERYAEMLKFFKSIEDENFACAAEWVEKTLEHLWFVDILRCTKVYLPNYCMTLQFPAFWLVDARSVKMRIRPTGHIRAYLDATGFPDADFQKVF